MASVELKKAFDTKLLAIITSSIVITCSILVIILSYIISYKYTVTDYLQLINSYYNNRMIYTSETIFNLLMALFIIPSMIGIISYLTTKILEKAQKWLLIPLLASILGAGLVVILYCFKFVILFKIVPNYYTIDPIPVQSFVELVKISDKLSTLAFYLLYTVGVGILGIITLRTSSTKNNVSWLAIITGILALGKVGNFIDTAFGAGLSLAASMGVVAFFIWLALFIVILYNARKEDEMDELVEDDEEEEEFYD
jgi:hypothetical protein